MRLRTGKLPPELLGRLLRHRGAEDRRVLLGPKLGEDAALVRIGGHTLVLKTDPVTYASEMIGWYAVHVNANDVATRGATPAWFQACVLLPEGSDDRLVEDIFKQISKACRQLDIAVTGGHTEVTPGIDRPIVVGDMHGLLIGRRPVLTSGARVGDAIVLTKGAGIEGTALIAREKGRELEKILGTPLVRRASRFLTRPGLSVVPEARVALEFGVSAMHDPTEGGVAMGVTELATASKRSVEVFAERVKVHPETRSICDHYGIDPMGLLGSGALLATFRPASAKRYVSRLAEMRIASSIIGRIVPGTRAPVLVRDGVATPLSSSERDEVLRVL
jgi:hydrogenase maturation factor